MRRFPASRRLPQFHAGALTRALDARGIAYVSVPALGGRRRAAPDSPNDAWRHPNFRGYADHLASEEFADGLFELLMIGGGLRTAMLCAEVLWWRCHRRLIADVLTVLGYEVMHVQNEQPGAPHVLAPPARLTDGVLDYGSGAP